MTDDIESGLDGSGYALSPNEFSPRPEISQPAPRGLQKLPRISAYLTKGARRADPATTGLDAFGNPLEGE